MKRMVLCLFVLTVFLSFAVSSEAEVYEGYFIDQKATSNVDSYGMSWPANTKFGQSFIPEREATVSDIIANTTGVIFGILLGNISRRFYNAK